MYMVCTGKWSKDLVSKPSYIGQVQSGYHLQIFSVLVHTRLPQLTVK